MYRADWRTHTDVNVALRWQPQKALKSKDQHYELQTQLRSKLTSRLQLLYNFTMCVFALKDNKRTRVFLISGNQLIECNT